MESDSCLPYGGALFSCKQQQLQIHKFTNLFVLDRFELQN